MKFHAETFDEMAQLSKRHGTEMFEKKDKAHLRAQEEMMQLMSNPGQIREWMDSKRKEFDTLPNDQ